MENWPVKTNGSDTVSAKLTFVDAEQLSRLCDLKDQNLNNSFIEASDCQPERELSESCANDVGVDAQNEPSFVFDLLDQPSSSTIAACELICSVLHNDSRSNEHDVPREDLQNHSSGEHGNSVLSIGGQESLDGRSCGKRFSGSTEGCQQDSKRMKTSHDFEVSGPMTTGSQRGILGEEVVENPVVPGNFTEIENINQKAQATEVHCHIEEPSPAEDEIIPSASDIQADNSHEAQQLSSMDRMEGTKECRQQTEMTVSEGRLSEPTQECMESMQCLASHNVADNSTAIQAASGPCVETLIAFHNSDVISESVSESAARTESMLGSQQQQQPRDTPVDIILAESGDPEFSCTDVIGGEKGLSPFEVSVVIDNIIRRELEADQSSHGSEEKSDDDADDDDSGDEGSQSEEKLDENDDSCSNSESSSKMKEKGESSLVETEGDDQKQVPCETLLQTQDEMETLADCTTDQSAAKASCCKVLLEIGSKSDNVETASEVLIVSNSDQTNLDSGSETDKAFKQIDDKTEDGSKELDSNSGHSKLLLSSPSPDKTTPAKGNDFVSSAESDRVDVMVPEVRGTLTHESSTKEEDLCGSPDVGGVDKSCERLLAAGDAKCSNAMQHETESALDHEGETLAIDAPASATEASSKKMYDPFEDMDIVDEDAATGEDGFTSADEAHCKTKMDREERQCNRFLNDDGRIRRRGLSGRGKLYRMYEDDQGRDPYGMDREDQGQWLRDEQVLWSRDDRPWSYSPEYNRNSDREMYSESRMPPGIPPMMGPELTYRPPNYDPCSSGNMPSCGIPPPNFISQPGPLQAPGFMPSSGYMPPPPGFMPTQGGYGVPMRYGGMSMPSYFGQWGQWPTAGPAYHPVQQQQSQSYQEWYNWWQNYSTWYSSYMSGWNQPANQQADVSHYESQGCWSSFNQQCTTTPSTSDAPPPLQLPSSKQSAKNVSYAAKTDFTSSNSKVSYKPTVAKGPILNSASSLMPSSAPRLKFSISGPVSAVTQKSALSTKSSESSGKDPAAGEKIDHDQKPENNLWVGNLPLGTSAVDIRTLISKHGKVVKCKVGAMKSQKDSGLAALVTMETADDVGVCIQMLHESLYNGQKILVRKLKQQ